MPAKVVSNICFGGDGYRIAVLSRWTGDGKVTLHDLAEKYGVSAERVRQIEANAIKKLRGLMTA